LSHLVAFKKYSKSETNYKPSQ